MKSNKKRAVFPLFLLLAVFAAAPNAAGQQTYNIWAFQDLKNSIEFLMAGDYENAIISSTSVIRRDPSSSVAFTIRARAYYEKGVMANAIDDATQAIRHDRNNTSAYSIRANAHARNGNLNRAISDWHAVLRINPDNAEAARNIELARANR